MLARRLLDRSTERLTGLNRNTIMRLLVAAGEYSAKLLDTTLHGLNCRYVQCDEIWCFVGKSSDTFARAIALR